MHLISQFNKGDKEEGSDGRAGEEGGVGAGKESLRWIFTCSWTRQRKWRVKAELPQFPELFLSETKKIWKSQFYQQKCGSEGRERKTIGWVKGKEKGRPPPRTMRKPTLKLFIVRLSSHEVSKNPPKDYSHGSPDDPFIPEATTRSDNDCLRAKKGKGTARPTPNKGMVFQLWTRATQCFVEAEQGSFY